MENIPVVYGAFVVCVVLILVFSGRRGRYMLLLALPLAVGTGFILMPRWMAFSPIFRAVFHSYSPDQYALALLIAQVVHFPVFALTIWAVLFLATKVFAVIRSSSR